MTYLQVNGQTFIVEQSFNNIIEQLDVTNSLHVTLKGGRELHVRPDALDAVWKAEVGRP